MPFNPLPQTWFTGLTDDGTNITLPISSLPQVTAAELDSITGDVRKVLYAVVEQAFSAYNALEIANRPIKMTISKSVSFDTSTGIATNVYTFVFKNAITAQDVSSET